MTGAVSIMMGAASPMSVFVSPDSVIGIGTGTVTTNTTVASVSGGVEPYSYNWVRVSGSTLIDPTNGASSSTEFTSSGVISSTNRTALFRVDVTDVTGATASSGLVSATIQGSV